MGKNSCNLIQESKEDFKNFNKLMMSETKPILRIDKIPDIKVLKIPKSFINELPLYKVMM